MPRTAKLYVVLPVNDGLVVVEVTDSPVESVHGVLPFTQYCNLYVETPPVGAVQLAVVDVARTAENVGVPGAPGRVSRLTSVEEADS